MIAAVEARIENPRVGGSIPPQATTPSDGSPSRRAVFVSGLAGRPLAFPLFGLSFALTLNPHKALQTARRLAIAGSAIQPIYAIAFANSGFSTWWAGNILFSFAAVA
ncbi:hypothetical protein NMQ14_01175 [Methyloversatilis sp. XJ19-13]|nr:hypothetical protein [Methyloversatilis sp. XJ19-13]